MTPSLVTAPMRWHGPALDEDERDLAALVDQLASDLGTVLDDQQNHGALVRQLADLGIWALGAPEPFGGDAQLRTTAVSWERLGRYWPALALASVQVHAALSLCTSDDHADHRDWAMDVSGARRFVALVEAQAPHVDLEFRKGGVLGRVDRVDAGSATADVVVLTPDRGVLISSDACEFAPRSRTGLLGGRCSSVQIDAGPGQVTELPGDPAAARSLVRLGASVVACGIAGAAADSAADYVAHRRQFGGPLIDLPTVRRSIADQLAWVRVCAAMLWGPGATEVPGGALLRHATDGAIDIAASALQAHGGYGYLIEYPVERHLRDAVSLRAATAGFRGTSQEET